MHDGPMGETQHGHTAGLVQREDLCAAEAAGSVHLDISERVIRAAKPQYARVWHQFDVNCGASLIFDNSNTPVLQYTEMRFIAQWLGLAGMHLISSGGGSRGSPGGPWTTLDFGPGAPPPSPRRPKRKKAQQRLGLVGSRGEPQRRTAQARSPLRSNPPPNRVASPLLSRLRHSLRSPRSSSPPPLALRRSGRCQRHRPSAARARRGNTPAGGGHDSTPAAPHGGDGASASGPSPSCSTSRRLCSSLPLVPYYPAPLPLAPGRPAPASASA
ncbi:Os02g0695300 [Oryza sativa Japonica Group]|uniref:Os02g0695300 protein n=1 Tax=Oryza sativa subsp. japonica TaxID=39947 RepID=C7IYZ2_ORYSJ|nr:Os02g0695300 [Oryza sativa Japonica Group]|eukprot:NP_001173123.1 Os02g0695300 [Oryza sativa Japonica Group]